MKTMKIKSFMTMMVAAVALVMGVSSCGSDDDEPEVAVAAEVAGSYEGNEIVMVDNDESSNETKTYVLTKVTDASIDMNIPEIGMGMMTIPALTVNGIGLKKEGNTIAGRLATYNGKVTNAKGEEKAYTVSDVNILFGDKNVVVTFSLKYGTMPFIMATTFTGTKKN
jgi:hypothetical protein